jgi:phosphotransferase system enzyme I (PtsI)
MDGVDALAGVEESQRPAEAAKLIAAASAVADRLRERARRATGAASEVLAATAGLAQDRAWIGDAEKRIAHGTPSVRATVQALAHFAELFTRTGGVMAERATDLRDIRDRVVAELSGLPEPGVPQPARPSILCAEDLAPVVCCSTARWAPSRCRRTMPQRRQRWTPPGATRN